MRLEIWATILWNYSDLTKFDHILSFIGLKWNDHFVLLYCIMSRV